MLKEGFFVVFGCVPLWVFDCSVRVLIGVGRRRRSWQGQARDQRLR